MSGLLDWAIVLAAVAGAVLWLARRFRSVGVGSCSSGCGKCEEARGSAPPAAPGAPGAAGVSFREGSSASAPPWLRELRQRSTAGGPPPAPPASGRR